MTGKEGTDMASRGTRGGSPQVTFRQGKLGPELRARIGTEGAASIGQVAQRDLGRYYDLLRLGREQLAQRDSGAVAAAIVNPDDAAVHLFVATLTALERAALDDLRERYDAAETNAERELILQEPTLNHARP